MRSDCRTTGICLLIKVAYQNYDELSRRITSCYQGNRIWIFIRLYGCLKRMNVEHRTSNFEF